ncbi:hypothetical protein EW145_g4208 [Phellinidium pouzarii]|uniref:Uncharacterized protein n=1 Tax=Phellinidium pouzarii TaxID=167371 RepID=A0A4S4L9E8_9AGAM|nr:hypothetical protein EW145_g4208 [Phellinidium pouzarii]
MHRRKSSKDNTEQENLLLPPEPAPQKSAPIPFPDTPQCNEQEVLDSQSSPLKARQNFDSPQLYEQSPAHRPTPTSAGPYRTSFGTFAQSLPNGYNHSSSPLRRSYTHSRTVSSGGAVSFASPMLSPPPYGGGSFPTRSITMPGLHTPNLTRSPPEPLGSSPKLFNPPASPPSTRRHHQRIHSLNLSVFFPRPGSLPVSAIAEDADGVQEIAYPDISLNEAPVTLIPSGPSQVQSVRLHSPPGPRRLGEGFTFGGRSTRTVSNASTGSSSDGASNVGSVPMSSSAKAKRRGHHHKHSVSHNFFSFLDPGSSQISTSPEQNWNPISPFSASSANTNSTFVQAQTEGGTAVGLTSPNLDPLALGPSKLPKDTTALAALQFILGASLWVSGQQHGSLACTGLGYWVVFDSFVESEKAVWTIYLIFSSVYVCKEAVEHLLLSVGDGHHHHYSDEDISTEGTCLFYNNHSKILSTCGHKLPSFSRILRFSRTHAYPTLTPTTPIAVIFDNPFTVAPLFLSFSLVVGVSFLPTMATNESCLLTRSQHQSFDLLLALLEAILTFKIAYPAAVVQGAVLLQTAPLRGMPSARMEAFLRVMREIERHPLVLHLPAPHMWQLTPTITSIPPHTSAHLSSLGLADALVVTLELHVRRDTDDGEVIALTRWAHERCRLALGLGAKDRDREDGTEVTIGIVKG